MRGAGQGGVERGGGAERQPEVAGQEVAGAAGHHDERYAAAGQGVGRRPHGSVATADHDQFRTGTDRAGRLAGAGVVGGGLDELRCAVAVLFQDLPPQLLAVPRVGCQGLKITTVLPGARSSARAVVSADPVRCAGTAATDASVSRARPTISRDRAPLTIPPITSVGWCMPR